MVRRPLLFALVLAAVVPSAAQASTPPTFAQMPGLDACISQTGSDPSRGSQQDCTHGSGLSDVFAVATSPDGKNVYSLSEDTLSMMSRDPVTGALTPLGCISSDGTDGGTGTCTRAPIGLESFAMVISPDGHNVYVASEASPGGIKIFDRDPATGLLTQPSGPAGCIAETGSGLNCVPGKNVDEPLALAISPDGKSMYAADGRGGVAVLRRSADGSLSQSADPQTGCITEDGKDADNIASSMACVDGKVLRSPEGLAVSPDGKQVYVSDADSAGVAVLDRDQSNGELSQSAGMDGCLSENGDDGSDKGVCSPAHALVTPGSVLVAPDGGQVFVSAFESGGLALFDRNSATGDLKQAPGTAGCITENGTDGPEGPANTCTVGRNLSQAFGLAQSPDGTKLYVGSDIGIGSIISAASSRGLIIGIPHASGGVAFFDRDPATGALQQPAGAEGCVNEAGGPLAPSPTDGCAPGIALQGVDALSVSADGANLYAGASDSSALAEFGPPASPAATGPARDGTAPRVSRFSLTHRVFAIAHAATPISARARTRARGTAFRFRLSESAAVRISIKRAAAGKRVGRRCVKPNARNRHRRACTRHLRAGTLRRGEQPGNDTVKFSGRIGRRALKPGRYRAMITATDAAGNVSKPRSVAFRIVH